MADFEIAATFVLTGGLVAEGGYEPASADDPGGETNFGISKRAYPEEDIRSMTEQRAREIYRRDFWRFDAVRDQGVANKLLDLEVNLGLGNGSRLAQQALVIFFPGEGVAITGVFGPLTLAKVNRCDPAKYLMELRARQCQRYCQDLQANPAEKSLALGLFRRAAK